jgi:Flp pilus assembly protein TadB
MFQRKTIIDVWRLYRPTSLQNFWDSPQTENGDRRFLQTFETAISLSQTRYIIVVLAYLGTTIAIIIINIIIIHLYAKYLQFYN